MCKAYAGADEESVRSLCFLERNLLLLLHTEHEQREGKHQGLPRASERYANHVTTIKTVGGRERKLLSKEARE